MGESIDKFDKAMDDFEEQVLASYRADIKMTPLKPRTINEWIEEFIGLSRLELHIICHKDKKDAIEAALLQYPLARDGVTVTVSRLVEPDQMYVMTRPFSPPYAALPIDWNLTE